MSVKEKLLKLASGFLLLILVSGSLLTAQAADISQGENPPETESSEDVPRVIDTRTEVINEHQTTIYYTYDDGSVVEEDIVNGPSEPPSGYDEMYSSIVELPPDAVTIANFPSYSWVFGCSAVSGAMIAGYLDRNGFPNMYTGPTNGGVMPLTDTSWSTWFDGFKTYPNNPLVASHQGVDGRTTKGSIDDYWVKSKSTANDPYITGGWTQHTWGTAIGDYMKTSQSAYGNIDGSTKIHQWNSGSKMTCADMVGLGYANSDGTYGRKLFYEKRGYTVTECYTQATDNYATSGGFTLADYKAEIDAGNPVFISVVGHSMVGYGYGTGNTIYIRNTWDNDPSNTYSMQWGGSYEGMEMKGARIVHIKKTSNYVPKPLRPVNAVNVNKPTYKWTKVTGATNYVLQIYEGNKRIFTKNLSSSVCGSTTCQFRTNKYLPIGYYKWRVKAKVGIWRKWSNFKNFNVATPFHYFFNNTSAYKYWHGVYGPWKIKNGLYSSGGLLSLKWASAYHEGNYQKFQYIVNMKRLNNKTAANRIVVRATVAPLSSDKNWKNYYSFQYTNQGYFSVWKRVNGVSTYLKGWTYTPAIHKHGWNALKVKGVGSSLKFYINNKLVWSGSSSSLSTGKVGVGFYKSGTGSQALLVDAAHLIMNFPTTSEADVWAEIGETITEWDNEFESPPVP